MIKSIKKTYYNVGASMALGVALATAPGPAHSAATNNISTITQNIGTSISDLPGLVAAVSYLFGIMLVILGILKIKDHVENPGNAHLKDGAIRMLAGGALFAAPMMYEALLNTVGVGTGVTVNKLKAATFSVS